MIARACRFTLRVPRGSLRIAENAGVRKIGVNERRARLATRHRLAPGFKASDVVAGARSLVAYHATDPASVFLAARARVDGMEVADMERALYEERSLIKHLAMRRTLFVFPREAMGDAQAGASESVAGIERRRLIGDVERAGLHRDGERWLAKASAAVLETLADGREASSTELRDEIKLLEGFIEYGQGKSWGGRMAIGPRVLTSLSAAGRIVRASNAGAWTSSRPRWTSMQAWLGEELPARPQSDGVAALIARWLRAFGPGTEKDIRWWLGSTLGAVRKGLADVGAVEVDLGGTTGFLLRDDLEPADPVDPWAALLPPLDPTTMGWTEREWYLGPYRDQLFDTAGNAGPTIWWEGRIVGGWRQDDEGAVILQPLEDVGADALVVIEAEAERLERWLGGVRVLPRFPSPLSRSG